LGLGGDEALHLPPKRGLAARDLVEVFRSGDRGIARSSGLRFRALLRLDAPTLFSALLGLVEKLNDGSPLDRRLARSLATPVHSRHALKQFARERVVVPRDQSREKVVLFGERQLRKPRLDFGRLRYPRQR
jgi:hypothetical protein